MLRPSHRSCAWLSQNILSRLLVIDLQAGKLRTIPAMKYRPAVWRLGSRLCISERFANRISLQLCSNGGQTLKSGRSQTNTSCVEDRTGVSRSDIHEHAVTSGDRFRSRRRRCSLSGPVGGGAGGTRFILVDIRCHARFWVGFPTAERFV